MSQTGLGSRGRDWEGGADVAASVAVSVALCLPLPLSELEGPAVEVAVSETACERLCVWNGMVLAALALKGFSKASLSRLTFT